MRGIVCFLSFIFVLGTVGALEMDNITIGQAIFRSIVGLSIFYFTSKKYWDYNEKETYPTKGNRF